MQILLWDCYASILQARMHFGKRGQKNDHYYHVPDGKLSRQGQKPV